MNGKAPRPLRILPVVDAVRADVQLDPYLSLNGLSQYLSISARRLRAHVHDPVSPLPAYQLSGRLLFRVSEVDRWMAARRVQPVVYVKALVDDVVKNLLERPR